MIKKTKASLSTLIKNFRARQRWSQYDLADCAGVSQSSVMRLEKEYPVGTQIALKVIEVMIRKGFLSKDASYNNQVVSFPQEFNNKTTKEQAAPGISPQEKVIPVKLLKEEIAVLEAEKGKIKEDIADCQALLKDYEEMLATNEEKTNLLNKFIK